jgi:hypothetical protein
MAASHPILPRFPAPPPNGETGAHHPAACPNLRPAPEICSHTIKTDQPVDVFCRNV